MKGKGLDKREKKNTYTSVFDFEKSRPYPQPSVMTWYPVSEYPVSCYLVEQVQHGLDRHTAGPLLQLQPLLLRSLPRLAGTSVADPALQRNVDPVIFSDQLNFKFIPYNEY